MKKALILCSVLLLALSSCINQDFVNSQQPGTSNPDFAKFDFSTSATMNLDIRYQDMGGITAPVYFEIY